MSLSKKSATFWEHALNEGEVQAINALSTTMDLRFPGQWFQLERDYLIMTHILHS